MPLLTHHTHHNMPTLKNRMALVIDSQLRNRLNQLAQVHRRSTSAEICVAIEAWLAANDTNDDQQTL